MKKIFSAVLLFMLFVLSSQAQYYKSDVFLSEKLLNSEPIPVVYNPIGTDLEFSDEVRMGVYSFDEFEWRRTSVSMTKGTDGTWTAEVVPGQNTAFIAVKFFQGDINQPDASDNNHDLGFATMLLDSDKKPVLGARLGMVTFLMPDLVGGGIVRYYDKSPAVPTAAQLAAWIAPETRALEALAGNSFLPFMKVQQLVKADAFDTYAVRMVHRWLKEKSLEERFLGVLYRYVATSLKDEELAARVESRIREDYPDGSESRKIAYDKVLKTGKDLSAVANSYTRFLQEFPIAEWRKKPDQQGFIYYSAFRGLGTALFESRQLDRFIALYKTMDFRTANEVTRWNIMRAYRFKTMGMDTLYTVSSAIMPQLIAVKADNSYRNDFMDQAAADSNLNKQLDDRLFIHLSLLNDLGKDEEAYAYFSQLSAKGKYANSELNEIIVGILERLQKEKELLSWLEMSVKNNAVTPGIFVTLKRLYQRSHDNSDVGYEDYLADLKSEEGKVALERYVSEHLTVNYPMPDFALESADGSLVKRSDLKDKIVVIDFWATWCRPCIMAFPGMQLLVDKYSKDKDVCVYMVGTMQHGDYKNKSVNFVKGEGYRFNLLHDANNPETGSQDYLFKQLVGVVFNDSSIPRKIVIKNGVIRYQSGGYSGSPSQLMDELSLVIEKLKSE